MIRGGSIRKPGVIRVALAGLILAYGFFISGLFDPLSSARWVALTAVLYGAPLAAQVVPSGLLRVYSLWFGVFLVVQAVISPWFLADKWHYLTLPRNMSYKVDVVGDGLPGIQGMQNISTDAKGFRVTPPVDYDADEGVRIFALGGSTTEQILLDDKATWTYLLQERLKKDLGQNVQVINTGVSGTRAIHHLATLKNITRYRPDVALFLIGINDWNKQIREHFGSRYFETNEPSFHSFKYTLLGSVLHRVYLDLIDSESKYQEDRIDRGEYYTNQRDSLAREIKKSYRPDSVSEDYRTQLSRISDVCRERGLECVFITQPNGYASTATPEFRAGFWMTPPNEDFTLDLESMAHVADLYNRFLIEFANSNGHPVIDLAAAIPPGHAYFYDDAHFNTAGAAKVAEVLAPGVASVVQED